MVIVMIVNMKKMLKDAKEEKYAVPQFNVNNLEWAKYILQECQLLSSPVIIGVSEGAAKYMGGLNVVASMVRELDKSLEITIPVAIHLDHGSSIESCKQALKAGFTSVMLDASSHKLEDNIKMTAEVVKLARKYKATVEAEIGQVGGAEDGVAAEVLYADPTHCEKMAKQAKITALAPALGSVHGLYKEEPKLAFDRMLDISMKTKLPLVLHGGTGIPKDQIRKAIECGTCKINVNTELQIAWRNGVINFINANPSVYDPRKIIGGGENLMRATIREKVTLFGSGSRV